MNVVDCGEVSGCSLSVGTKTVPAALHMLTTHACNWHVLLCAPLKVSLPHFLACSQKIAGEKAGILKKGRPGLTVPQPEDALEVIKVNEKEMLMIHC